MKTLLTITLVIGAATATNLSAQTFSTLFNFNYSDGAQPNQLIQAANGELYGTTLIGGTCTGVNSGDGCGTIFKITPSGAFTSIYQFCTQAPCMDADVSPEGPLAQGADGDFYGTTQQGSSNCTSAATCGTIFKVTPGGVLTTLYNFCAQPHCTDGEWPLSGLIRAANGNFYGTTFNGGHIGGTVFRITPSGTFTTLHHFCVDEGPTCLDGSEVAAGLIQAKDGNFYGTTELGGIYDGGTIFKITPAGTLTTLYSFCSQTGCPDGDVLAAGLVQGKDGNFYGVTTEGGSQNAGTVFKLTLSATGSTLTTLYNFCSQAGCADGYEPEAALIQATDGNFYGTTEYGGNSCESVDNGEGCGTIFRITPAGDVTTLYKFCSQDNCADGLFPRSRLLQAANGDLYGSVSQGGPNGNDGNLFKLTIKN